jgi:hypothetical protein
LSLADDLNLLGSEGLSGQYITVRVKSIDRQKLAQALGGVKGAAIPAALAVVDFAPQQSLGILMPIVKDKVNADYGVDLEYQVSEVGPAAASPGGKAAGKGGMSGKAVALGVVVGLVGAVAASHFGVVGVGRNLLHKVGL